MALESSKFNTRAFFVVLMLMILIPWISLIGPSLETKYMPVNVDVTIHDIEVVDRNGGVWTKFYVTSDKVRQCAPANKAAWYRRVFGVLRPVSLDYTEAVPQLGDETRSRPLGVFTGGPYYVDFPPHNLTEHAVVKIDYNCHIFWTTVDEFYPEESDNG